MSLQVRLVRPWGDWELSVGRARFSTTLGPDEADALLCEWAPTEELLSFDGPSAWYTCEPRTNPRIGVLSHPDQERFLARLRPEQMLHQAHEDLRYRVPHVTHRVEPVPMTFGDGPRRPRAATIVSNYGGPLSNRGPDIRLRNRFATAAGLDLYGRRSKWRHYRTGRWSLPRLPSSYSGEAEGSWGEPRKVEILSRYHTAVCLENTCEPYYFSEKMVDAALGGCVPVYRAHPTVRDGILREACWVDPADFEMDVDATLEHALSLDRVEVDAQNRVWLESEAVLASREDRVFARIADALRAQADAAAGGTL